MLVRFQEIQGCLPTYYSRLRMCFLHIKTTAGTKLLASSTISPVAQGCLHPMARFATTRKGLHKRDEVCIVGIGKTNPPTADLLETGSCMKTFCRIGAHQSPDILTITYW